MIDSDAGIGNGSTSPMIVSSVLLVVVVTPDVVVSYLDLSGNQLSGTIPSTISVWTVIQ